MNIIKGEKVNPFFNNERFSFAFHPFTEKKKYFAIHLPQLLSSLPSKHWRMKSHFRDIDMHCPVLHLNSFSLQMLDSVKQNGIHVVGVWDL